MNAKIYNRQAVAPRSRNWQQIEVAGEHAARLGEARVVQVLDEAALRAIAADIQGQARDPLFDGILVDADHLSHDADQRTEAYAWLMNAEVRDGQLWGELEWTDLGAAAVHGGRYKYFSTEYDAGDLEDLGSGRVRPARLAGLALTNRPNNKGGRPITNRKGETSPEQNPTQPAKTMKNIAEKLGLPAEATEDEIVAEIGTIQNRARRAEELESEAAAEEILNRNAKRIPEGQRDAWKAELIRNREGAERLILTLPEAVTAEARPSEGRRAITNRATAGVPGAERAHGEGDETRAARQQAAILTIQNRDRCRYVDADRIARLENPALFAQG
jgi:phage I-like protein